MKKYKPKIATPNPEGKYKCSICGKTWETELYKISCEKGHNVIYIPMTKEQIFKLVQFFFTMDKELIPSGFVEMLMKFTRVKKE